MATGMGRKKNSAAPTETASMDSTTMPAWMTGEAPMPPPKRKKGPRVDSGGILSRGSMKLA